MPLSCATVRDWVGKSGPWVMDRMVRTSIKALALCGALGILAGCSGVTTYGTGIDPGTQTIRDITGLVKLSPDDKEQIQYQERAGIVAPPNAALPPPGEQPTVVASNFPVDPETRRKELQRQADEAGRPGELLANDPAFWAKRPKNESSTGIDCDESDPRCMYRKIQAAKGTLVPSAKAQKLDENGVPVRKYLYEPPSEYREPDPDAPMQVTERKEEGGFFSRLWPF